MKKDTDFLDLDWILGLKTNVNGNTCWGTYKGPPYACDEWISEDHIDCIKCKAYTKRWKTNNS